MASAILATGTLFTDYGFVLISSLVCVAGTCFSFAFRRVEQGRALTNWLVLAACAGLGVLQFSAALGSRGLFGVHPAGQGSFEDVNLLELLASVFVWITAFRAFALRTLRDLTLCLLPSVSVLLLVVVLRPDPAMAGFFGAVLLGGLYLFAVEHRAALAERADFEARGRHGVRQTPDFAESSWLTVYAASVIIGTALCVVFTSITLPSRYANALRIELAQRLSEMIVSATRSVYAASDRSVWLYAPTYRLSDTEIFRVRCDRELYWRMTAYDLYTGHSWTQMRLPRRPDDSLRDLQDVRHPGSNPPPGMRRAYRTTLTATVGLDALGESTAGLDTVRQLFFLKRPVQGAVIAAYCPVRVEGRFGKVRLSRFGGLETSRPLHAGEEYVAHSLVRRSEPGLLARSGTQYPKSIVEAYTAVHPRVPPRVWDLAERICADQHDPYAKAHAIETYLGDHYRYREDTRRPPWDQDYVDYFLFGTREGCCTHFASAMAILARCVGLPTRLAAGYAPGEYDAEDDVYVVREKDAHIWVEVYFDGIGWVQFDPTRGAQEGHVSGAAALYAHASEWWKRMRARYPLLTGDLTPGSAFGGAAFAACVLGLLALLIRRRRLRASRRLPKPSPEDHRGQVQYAYSLACRALARARLSRGQAQTPFEFAEHVAAALPPAALPFLALSSHHVLITYGDRAASPEVVERAKTWLREVVRAARGRHPAQKEPG
jgi:transglutaminase-like putative cysteine protease